MSNPRHSSGRFLAVREDKDLTRVEWEPGVSITDDDAQQLIDCIDLRARRARTPVRSALVWEKSPHTHTARAVLRGLNQ